MSFFEILVLSLSLALDTFGVGLATGAIHKKISVMQVVKIAGVFGLFHVIMPIIGFFSGSLFKNIIFSVDHWVAFVLLLFVGGKMIYEALSSKDATEEEVHKKNILRLSVLITLAFATSIDAFVTGITFPFIQVSLITIIFCISVSAFTLSFVGVYLGKKFGELFGDKIEVLGGIALCVLAFRVLFSHLGIL